MASAQVSDIIRLGSFVIPILVLLLAGQAVRFDPNRRLSRPSVVRKYIRPFDQPWGRFLFAFRVMLVALLLLDVVEIVLTSVGAQQTLTFLPSWAIFHNPNGSAMYAMLALLAIWFVGYLKHTSMNIFDQVFESHLDFADWRIPDPARDDPPPLHLANWRYEMKWNFKTNPEPIDALHIRMLMECPTYAEFSARIEHDQYPDSFQSILQYSPYGWIIGDTKSLMRRDVRRGLYQAPALWEIWQNQPNPYNASQIIDSPEAMADMLYTELRGLLVCPNCRARPEQVTYCEACSGSGARMASCALCAGSGLAPDKPDKQACKDCGGTGLLRRPVPNTFMNRLQYLWMARNVDLMKRLFPVWLSNLTYFSIFASTTALFFGVSLAFNAAPTVDLAVQALLFGEAVLLGMLSGAIVFVFAGALNGSGMLLSSYPLRDTKFGNRIWVQLMNLLGVLTFGSLLIDTTFVMSQFLFVHNLNVSLLTIAATTVTAFVLVVSFGGFYTIHTAMRDAKRARLDEIADWLHQSHLAGVKRKTDQEEEFFKEIRELQEWPIDIATTFGIVSGAVIPIVLAFSGPISSSLSVLLHGL